MKKERYNMLVALLTILVAVSVALSISLSSTVIAPAVMLLGIAVLFALRTRIKEIVKDEMVYRISEKASRRAFQGFVLCAGLSGATIFLVKELSAAFTPVAQTFLFSICLLLVLYLGFYAYYSRKGV